MTREVHPNSLKNLAPSFTKDNAREMQLNLQLPVRQLEMLEKL